MSTMSIAVLKYQSDTIHDVAARTSQVLTYLLHEDEHGFSVFLPLVCQFALMRKLIAAQEHRQLQAVGVQVAEVIHT